MEFLDLSQKDQEAYRSILKTIVASPSMASADELMSGLTAPGKLKAIKRKDHHAVIKLAEDIINQYLQVVEQLCQSDPLILFDQQMGSLTAKAKLQAIEMYDDPGAAC